MILLMTMMMWGEPTHVADVTFHEFAEIMALSYGGGSQIPELMLGDFPAELPDDWPHPPSSEFIGTVHRERRFVLAYRSKEDLAFISKEIRRKFVSLGYRPDRWNSERTFSFCGPERQFSRVKYQLQPTTDWLFIFADVINRHFPCRSEAHEKIIDEMPRVEFPIPDNAEAGSRRSGSSGGFFSTSIELTTSMTTTEVYGHFERHLLKEGWERMHQSISMDRPMSKWEFTTKSGHIWIGTLTVNRRTGDRHRMVFMITLDSE